MTRFRDRPTGDLLVILIAGTVCTVVLGGFLSVVVIELVHPESDTDQALGQIGDIVNTLIGLLAGFLAGRTDANATERQRQEHEREQRRLNQERKEPPDGTT